MAKIESSRRLQIDSDEVLKAIEKLAKSDSENLTKFLYDNTVTLMKMHSLPAIDALELLLAVRFEIVERALEDGVVEATGV
jgi:hypothetical protein